MPASFVHLHNHSQYSLLDGACKLDLLVKKAADMEMPSIALTDHGNMFGAVHFYEKARKAGVKPIIGCEAYVAEEDHTDRTRKSAYHLVLLARNETGYKNLMKLCTKAYLDGFYYKPRIDLNLLEQHGEGLIGLSACLQGQVNQALLREDVDKARALAGRFTEILGKGNFYIETQDHGISAEQSLHRPQLELARALDLPLVATNDCHYLERGHAAAHDCLMCIQTGKVLSDTNRMKHETDALYMKTPEEMAELFREVPEAISNTLRISEQCNVELDMKTLHLPVFELPAGFENADGYLRHLCVEGVKDRYPTPSDEVWTRLDYELGIIQHMGYAGYFLIVQDFIRHARGQGIPVGPGRGSAAGSLVAYTSGITNIDPLRYDLLFERFLNPERVSMPDIDIDFSDRGRQSVIEYTVEKYGQDSVAQIITFGSMAARAVIRDVGRAMSLSFAEVDRIAKMVPAELGITLEKALESSPDLKEAAQKEPTVHELLSHAQVLEGLSRHASTHAAGVVITPGPIADYVPLYKSSKDEVTTQYDMKALDKIGLLKMDFLGLRTLTVIEDAVAMIEENRGVTIDVDKVPLGDEKVFEMLGRGETVGVFQFESSGMREYLRKLKPSRLDDLIAMNALYRPGPLGSGMVDDYIERRHGRQEVEYLHPLLEPILESTYGVICYQEQVMRIASDLAGYTLGAADLLRRAMGKKIAAEMAEQRKIFMTGAKERGIEADVATRIFDLMEYFAGYGFNKSHSAGYAYVAYQTAFLKAHYPVEFMAATMTSEMSNSDRIIILMGDCRRMGVPVDPPDVNASRSGFVAVGDRIRFGMSAVKGVGQGAVEAIVAARERVTRFETLDQFCWEVDLSQVNKKAIESLIRAGAMDTLEPNRARLHAAFADVVDRTQRQRKAHDLGQTSLFGDPGEEAMSASPLPPSEPWPTDDLLRHEKEALGFYVSGHPLDSVARELRSLTTSNAEGLDHVEDGQSVTVGGIVVGVKRQFDKKGNTMARVQVEDFTGSFECLVFHKTYASCGSRLVDEARLLVSGRASAREGERATVIVDDVRPLDDAFRGLDLHLQVFAHEAEWSLDDLKALLEEHRGNSRVVFHVRNPEVPDARPVIIRLKHTYVDPDRALVARLKKILGAEAVWLGGGRPVGIG